MRGRVYNLQRNHASSSYIATDGLGVGAHDQILIFFVWQLLSFFFMYGTLTPIPHEQGGPAQSQKSKSH
jgi:hypothetical protein